MFRCSVAALRDAEKLTTDDFVEPEPRFDAMLQLVAVVAVIFREGKVLAMRRSASKDAGAELWETVSGRVSPGEEPYDAVVREIVEETALEARVEPRPVDAYAARRGEVPMTVLVYRADWLGGEVRRSAEHDDHAWWTPQQFERNSTLGRLAASVFRAREAGAP